MKGNKNILYKAFAEIMIDERKSANLTQKQLATLLSKPQSYVSKYERGERRLDVIEFIHILKLMNKSPEAVIEKIKGELKSV